MRPYILLIALFLSTLLSAQVTDSIPQKDFIDLVKSLKKHQKAGNTPPSKFHKIEFSLVPSPSYSLSTGFAAVVTANAAFYLGEHATTNMSTVYVSPIYTQYNQITIPIQANIWTKDNGYNIQTNWALMFYPSDTYGLGTLTEESDAMLLNFSYIRLYQSVLKNLGSNWYAGVGYNLDYYFKTTIDGQPTSRGSDALTYGITPTSFSSGGTLNVLYDNRKNPIHPKANEQYANITCRNNATMLGSNNNWQSLLIDLRKYIKWGKDDRHILALWSYNAFTLAGNPPYEVLPSTGWDAYSNTGRGYVQGRFRGKNMLYLESEYRFPLSRNGLFGGVVFVNSESFTEPTSNHFEALAIGYGAGIRFKLNKFSNTNLAFDYGFGANGSRGFFVNLGEVF